MGRSTNSSIQFTISFPNEMATALRALEAQTNEKSTIHVRRAIIEYLASRGFDVASIPNPTGQGARGDLQKLPEIKDSSRRPRVATRKNA